MRISVVLLTLGVLAQGLLAASGKSARASEVVLTIVNLLLAGTLARVAASRPTVAAPQLSEAPAPKVTHAETAPMTSRDEAFRAELDREVRRARRHGNTVALALIEVDDFDQIVPKDGASIPKSLARLAELLSGRRAEDRSFYLNRGKFALILPYTTALAVQPLMEHLRRVAGSSGLETTVSIGMTDLEGEMDATALLQRAEEALEEARSKGRNTLVTRTTNRRRSLGRPA